MTFTLGRCHLRNHFNVSGAVHMIKTKWRFMQQRNLFKKLVISENFVPRKFTKVIHTQLAFTCSKLTIEREQDVKYVES